ncbi:hypothetical protein VFPBJ_01275 [Purpureocillium lilacinum]|uniref:Uncharacterized protein n=1 Tax=Purpureocillium lilacinum TaxID=33203 RepID=A0A179HAC5_PURLI|nr:hypothetical protein VFPBJ_01275 [Purpureocillium lilacinum]
MERCLESLGERQGARIACATLGKDGGRTGELGRRGETLVAFWKPSAMFGGRRSKDGGEGAGVTNTKARHRRRSMSTSMGWAAAEGVEERLPGRRRRAARAMESRVVADTGPTRTRAECSVVCRHESWAGLGRAGGGSQMHGQCAPELARGRGVGVGVVRALWPRAVGGRSTLINPRSGLMGGGGGRRAWQGTWDRRWAGLGPPTRSQSWTYDGSRRRREETEGGAGVLEDGRVDDDDDDDTTMKKGKPGGGGGGGRENSGSRKAGGEDSEDGNKCVVERDGR